VDAIETVTKTPKAPESKPLPVLTYPNPKLRLTAKPAGEIDDKLRSFIGDLTITMQRHNGASIAATQVGADLRIVVLDGSSCGTAEPRVFINPEIISTSEETHIDREGCLSFPGCWASVERSVSCKVRAKNISGEVFEADCTGLFARAVQHELAHLDGKLMIDMVGPMKQRMLKAKMAKFNKTMVRRAEQMMKPTARPGRK
jgi:peptide deformylase